jgi:hypothetical protein
MLRTILPGTIAIALACGCATGEVGYTASVNATVDTPDLVTVSPGVQVIADYDEPIFYSDGFYWRFYDGVWYRSSFYTGGWTFVDAPPVAIVEINRPEMYRHYHPAGYVVRHRPVPSRRIERPPVVRAEQREAFRARVESNRGYVAPRPVERRPVTPPARERDRRHDKDHHEPG